MKKSIPILLVDDDEVGRKALLRFVRKEKLPYRLDTAKSSAEALEALQRETYDLILLDSNLGFSTGFDLMPHAVDTPVIIVIDCGSEEVAKEAIRQGASDYVVKDPERNYLAVLPVTIRSVLDRGHTSREVEHLRSLLGDIINSMPSVLVGVDHEGRVTRWNREAANIAGVSETDARGRLLEEVFPKLAGQMKNVKEAIRLHSPQKDEMVVRLDDEEMRLWEITSYPLTGSSAGGAVIRVDDVTERVRMETMMIHSEKMLSLGGFASGIAHELNNPLAGILHNTQVIQNRVNKEFPKNKGTAEACGISLEAMEKYMTERGILNMLDSIRDAGHRAAQIIDNLLTFSSSNDSQPAPYDLSELLDRVLEMATGDFKLKESARLDAIEIKREYQTPLPKVLCDPGKVQQVFYNVLKNGAQAMLDDNGSKSPRFVLRAAPENGYVRVEIEDNGPGMNEDVKKRIFDPFFTTRSVGKGTGLGLSVSYFIVTRDHMGTLDVRSSPGKGATFIIRLPLDRRAHSSQQ
jgi:PAS domain S-box-containing protein